MKEENTSIIYQWNNGEILLREDFNNETFWASQKDIANIFWIDRTVATRHISNIFKNGELDESVVCADFAHTTLHGAIPWKTQTKNIKHYNLDIILAVGYRTNSKQAISFRRWANSILKQYITQWYSINEKLLRENTQKFQEALEIISSLDSKSIKKLENSDVLNLIQDYASTWLSLESYDKQLFPKTGINKTDIKVSSTQLLETIAKLKAELISKSEATELFAQEKKAWSIDGIIGNIFQSFDWQDLYPTLEEKAAHLLYFVVKNHAFTDGNKRSGAFSFIWFLQKSEYKNIEKINPETLTLITLLIAESDPRDKDKLIGLVLLLLN